MPKRFQKSVFLTEPFIWRRRQRRVARNVWTRHGDPVDESPANQDEAEEVEEEPESHVQLSLTDSFGGSP